jgi:hypothetical protein
MSTPRRRRPRSEKVMLVNKTSKACVSFVRVRSARTYREGGARTPPRCRTTPRGTRRGARRRRRARGGRRRRRRRIAGCLPHRQPHRTRSCPPTTTARRCSAEPPRAGWSCRAWSRGGQPQPPPPCVYKRTETPSCSCSSEGVYVRVNGVPSYIPPLLSLLSNARRGTRFLCTSQCKMQKKNPMCERRLSSSPRHSNRADAAQRQRETSGSEKPREWWGRRNKGPKGWYQQRGRGATYSLIPFLRQPNQYEYNDFQKVGRENPAQALTTTHLICCGR